jgi:hypothetical protein
MARRHQRWIDTHAVNPSLAPCLLGTPTSDPCWKISTTTAGRVDLNPAA